MSISKFQQLKQILKKDFENTYAYLDKNLKFIHQFIQKFADYIECSSTHFFYIDPKNKVPSQNLPQDSVTVDNEGFFNFQLLVSILDSDSTFSINNSARNFLKQGLTPPSGVVLSIAIKQNGDSFIVKIPSVEEEQVKEFTVKFDTNYSWTEPDIYDSSRELDIDDSWKELLEFCFQVMKKIIEGGLNERISKLGIQTDNASKQAFGFWG
jgi:hypothetical protein